ncbi:Gfo/Idh/MocA family oxidoreductase [Nocardioides sp. TRM66260-LWL]|uniref:Gfo/Idh/MocA family protein n=1 Tax=Nocardioides sp. TRM66260-LWL TaxID=2874478 RepID=UPI001CC43748|nr:Gfo/Idh/MocA family oxidoreductase [Nocardioides sp. TRM66260-LWL]MBZ5734594.1 Gfo/Idh/MocA family oxidoreductase [Nocardioides sp. TRM66260-LWL]
MTVSPASTADSPADAADAAPEATPIRWGVLATGRIARSVARDLALVPGSVLTAVGSRRAEPAAEFAAWYAEETGAAAPRAHGSYEALVADPEVDVVYLASPHSHHLAHARLAFEAGKHVLCEKPVTLTRADAEEMVALARRHDRFLMEAMWTACHPVVRAVLDRLATGEVGTPRMLRAELGFVVGPDHPARLLDPALGASALLDMGIYPLTLAHLVLGAPTELRATAALGEGGIDLDVAIAGRYPGDALASLSASMTSWSDRSAMIATDRGRIVLHGQFHHPTHATFHPGGPSSPEPPVTIEPAEPVIGVGYGHEIAEVARCLRAGLRESPWVPHAQTLAIMGQLDDVRAQIGVEHPA